MPVNNTGQPLLVGPDNVGAYFLVPIGGTYTLPLAPVTISQGIALPPPVPPPPAGYVPFLLADGGPVSWVDAGVLAPLSLYALSPDLIASGTITRSAGGAATNFSVVWPDGGTGAYAGVESTSFPGAIDSYTVTHVRGGVTRTYTQAALTRDSSGNVTNRPAITVA